MISLAFTDEMYERMSVLPEDVHYICKICSPKGDRHWELVLKDSFLDGLKSVFNTVTQAKCAQHLLHIDEKVMGVNTVGVDMWNHVFMLKFPSV